MEDFLEVMLIFVVSAGIAFINYMMGYDAGYSEGRKESTRSLVNSSYKMRELDNEIRTYRIDRDILRRKYNDLQRKIKAMEGISE